MIPAPFFHSALIYDAIKLTVIRGFILCVPRCNESRVIYIMLLKIKIDIFHKFTFFSKRNILSKGQIIIYRIIIYYISKAKLEIKKKKRSRNFLFSPFEKKTSRIEFSSFSPSLYKLSAESKTRINCSPSKHKIFLIQLSDWFKYPSPLPTVPK